jgi:hypothetical protein
MRAVAVTAGIAGRIARRPDAMRRSEVLPGDLQFRPWWRGFPSGEPGRQDLAADAHLICRRLRVLGCA